MSTTKVITGKVRMSYCHVFEPSAMQEGHEKKYSVSLIIPKTDTETLEKVRAAIALATEEGKAKFGGSIPKNLKTPLRDGDEEREDDENYKGSFFINANSARKPGLVDEDLNPILDKEEFYSGCYGRASLNFYPYNASGSKGVACGLNNIQKLADGEKPGGGGSSAEDDFGSESNDDLN